MQAEQPHTGDVVGILLDQHVRIRDLFGQLHGASGQVKQQAFDELRRLLAVHEAAEEMVLRPATRAVAGGNPVARARNHEEHLATHMLADLERMDPDSTSFETALSELEAKVVDHAQREESEEFPLVSSARSPQQRAWLGRGLQVAELIAPTHPHPTAAGSTTAQYALGPFASMLDHARDVMRRTQSP